MSSATQKNSASRKAIQSLINTASEGGEADNYAGKRRCVRFADGVLLEITTDPKQSAEWKTVYMHNVSIGGCAFWSRRPLEIRTAVWVREVREDGSANWVLGEVSHCTSGIRGFLVGIAFGKAA